ncbi:hypothetical protein ACFYW1_29505 [Streptomyces sp. NPDC002669]|uniref:hypothetical protein n=1 Tax=Streptomyces sp. NPDC002669 TaxID=3364658 RepID=UPI0036A50C95
MRRHFITVDNLRAAVAKLVNATFTARDTAWWGQENACTSHSKNSAARSVRSSPATTWPAWTRGPSKLRCPPCTCSSPHPSTSTPRWSSRSWPNRPGHRG